MKKHEKVFFFIVFLSIFSLTLLSCADSGISDAWGSRSQNYEVLNSETERLLKHDYWNYIFNEELQSVFTVDDVRIDYYLGTYNGYVVFVVSSNNLIGGTSRHNYNISIGDYEFKFPLASIVYAWKYGENADVGSFYYLNDNSFKFLSLTAKNAKDMYEQYLAFNVIKKEDFYSGAFDGLNEKIKQQIKNDYWHEFFADWWIAWEFNLTSDDVWIDYYLGTYNDYVIIAILRNSRWTSRIILNGYEFIFPSDFSLYAWKQDSNESGHFYRILNEQDFNVLSLTLYDMEKMYERYLTFNILDDIRLTSNVFNGLEAETAWQIKSNFTQGYFPDDFQIHFYLGRYNDYSVFIILNQNPAMSFLHVGDFSLRFAYGSNAYAWKQDKESKSGKLYIVGKSAGVIERIDSDDFISSDDAISIYKQYLRFYNEGI